MFYIERMRKKATTRIVRSPSSRKRARLQNVRRKWVNTGIDESCEVSSSGQGISVDTSKEEVYLTFVAYSKRYMEWKYVAVSGKGVHLRDQPQLHDISEGENLLRIWEKAVVQGALKESDPFTSTESLRIIEHRTYTNDVTAKIAGDSYEKMLANAQLRAMSDDTVNALGLQREKAEQLLFYNPNLSGRDTSTMQGLEDRAKKYNIDI